MKYAINLIGSRKYVAKPGSKHSYTQSLPCIRWYATREEAERDLCPENERIMTPAEIFKYER